MVLFWLICVHSKCSCTSGILSNFFFYILISYKNLSTEICYNKIVLSVLAALLFLFQGGEMSAQNIRLFIRMALLLNRCI